MRHNITHKHNQHGSKLQFFISSGSTTDHRLNAQASTVVDRQLIGTHHHTNTGQNTALNSHQTHKAPRSNSSTVLDPQLIGHTITQTRDTQGSKIHFSTVPNPHLTETHHHTAAQHSLLQSPIFNSSASTTA